MNIDIRLGQCVVARFSKDDLAVRIEDYCTTGGWIARSLTHGRKVIVKTESQILYPCDENGIQTVADVTVPNRRSKATPPLPQELPIILPTPEIAVSEPISQPIGPLPLLDAAALVLRDSKQALSTREIIALVVERQLWESSGATPWATLNAALNRDIDTNGTKSRFKKKERGKFCLR